MINFNDVSFAYRTSEKPNVKNINLNIEKGEVVLLTGRSGCGKSTILNMISGIIPNHVEGDFSGDILIDSTSIIGKEIQYISYLVGSVFQNPKSQFFNLNTTDEILFSASNKGVSPEELKNRLDATVKLFNLASLLDRNIFYLSGGEKQKIACSSVYAGLPKVFIFDEPSANLDKENIEILKEIITKLKDEGHTIVIAEHRLYYLMDICDRILYIDNGEIIKEYSQDQFKALDDNFRMDLGLRTIVKPKIMVKSYKPKNPKLQVKNLDFSYRTKSVLKIKDLSFEQSKITAVIGANGVGKTTFANILCGLIKSKSIYYDNQNFSNRKRIKACNIVMQDVNHQLFTSNVTDEVFLDSPILNKIERNLLLESLDLIEFKDKHPLSLSGGQKQRVSIASSIASNKKIIIFDEPTSGLDYNNMIKVSKLLNKIKKKNIVIIVITHDYELINECCDNVVNLSKVDLYG